MTEAWLPRNRIPVILVEPVYKGNVGAVTRVMNNFGFTDLRIVGEVPKAEDYYVAVHSQEILDNAGIFDTLEEAVVGCDRLIALSRRRGVKKKVDFLPWNLAEYVHSYPELRIGLVFGRETYGLKDGEADLCHHRAYIPTAPHFPSLNLAQAVSVVLYEVFKAGRGKPSVKNTPASTTELGEASSFLRQVMQNMGYDRVGDTERSLRILDEVLLKAEATPYTLRKVRQIFNRFLVLHTGTGLKFEPDEEA
ncbi:MAG: RNA methyltransferase [Candidatus Cloacimonetes bacterium]|nr:RNA methyltransferase [Candidatus Cloacimonadota bacterium]